MQNKEIEYWLGHLPVLGDEDITDEMRQGILELLGHKGFGALLGLLLGQKQVYLFQLAAVPLDSAAQVARASVIQGRTMGIDAIRETLLDIAIRADAGNKEQTA